MLLPTVSWDVAVDDEDPILVKSPEKLLTNFETFCNSKNQEDMLKIQKLLTSLILNIF